MVDVYREPTDQEIDTILGAIDQISGYIDPVDGSMYSDDWHTVHSVLSALSDFELGLGLYHLETALFESGEPITVLRATLYQVFQIVYEQGIDAL